MNQRKSLESAPLSRLFQAARRNKMAWASAAAVVALLAARSLILLPAGAQPPAPPPASAPAPAAVDLTPGQLAAIQIGTVETYAFPIEIETVGSISFDEDPQIVQAESTLIAAAAADTLAGKELARAKSLYEVGSNDSGVSQRELEQATSDAETARAQLTTARYALRALGESDADMDALMAGARPPRAAASREWAVAYVAESDVPALRAARPAQVRVIAYPDKAFAATVSKVYAAVDPNTHRLAVRCAITDPQHLLRAGMLADVAIQVQKPAVSTSVPADAVVREGDGTLTVWVTADRRHFMQRAVTAGLREDGRVQILSGLEPGEQVVTGGAIFLDNMLQAPSGDD